MNIPFTYVVRDRTDEVIRLTYIPDDGRLTTIRKTIPVDYLTPESSEAEVDQFITLRAPILEWDTELCKIDQTYRDKKAAEDAVMLKRITVITL